MKRVLAGVAVGVIAVAAFIASTGSLSFTWPWNIVPEVNEVQIELTLPTEARIVQVEPIMLDCRARVHAEVPVSGRREHALFDQVYRTDTIDMVAIGDVDTCVDGGAAKVLRRSDGTTEIVIPAESIKFVRPRVNTVETAASVTVSKGLLGKVTDVFPWVSDDLGLTPTAYAYSQNVIGSSSCMRTAYTVTRGLITDAYRQQFIDQGADPSQLSVRIDGEPVYDDPEPIYMGDGVEMTVGGGSVTCIADNDLS
ncbi:MAG: hypothetical protein KJN63_12225 [Acidimicrobiia bacterium]|nr:hypothetical protein [Acidimicrobiia bacterium]